MMHTQRILTAIGLAACFVLGSWKMPHDTEAPTVFDAIQPSFELMEFIARSAFVNDYRTAHDSLVKDLKEKHIDLLSSTARTIKVGVGEYALPDQRQEVHFVSSDSAYWIDIIQHDDGQVLFDDWKQALGAAGLKTDIRNDAGGSVFLNVETTGNSALGALFYTGRNVFSVGIRLPFPVPEDYAALDATQQLTIQDKFRELYGILEAIAHRYVAPAALVFLPTPGKPLTPEQRLYGLIQFWTEVKYNFAFFDQVPDLDWDQVLLQYLPLMEQEQTDEEYYRRLQKMCALLEDGHTNIYPPASVEAELDAPPVALRNIQQKAMVENVAATLQDDIPIGSEVVRVAGLPTAVYLQDSIFPYISASTEYILFDWGIRELLKGPRGTSVKITLQKPNGEQREIELNRDQRSTEVEWVKQSEPWSLTSFKRLPGDIAYVALNSFGSAEILQEFNALIDTINSCQGLVIDVRENGGGDSDNAYNIVSHLANSPFLTSAWRTREHRAAYKAWGTNANEHYRDARRKHSLTEWDKMIKAYYEGDQWYVEPANTIAPSANQKINLPVVVLIGHNTASAAEDFLIALDQVKGVTSVGERTFGSTGQPLTLELPGGGSARICTKRDTYPNGQEFVGYGIEPDVYVENTVESFLEGSDPALTQGLNILKRTSQSSTNR